MNEETQTDGAAEAEPLPPPLPEAPPPPPPQAPPAAPAVTVPAQPHIPVGGIGATGRPGVPPTSRRVSAATESTPLFLGEPSDGGQHGPLLFDEAAEKEYGPSRWKATLEAIAAKVFWDGFLWERFAFVSSRGLGYGATSLPYFLLTGLGAAIGVFCGQLLYASAVYGVSAAQHHIAGQRVPTAKTLLMGLEHAALLAAAAFVAGTFWQPVANMMQAFAAPITANPNVMFAIVLVGLWLIQGTIFFCALHMARFSFHSALHLDAVEAAFLSTTLIYDATLAMSIGGAAGFFFATNGSYATNALTRAFGVMPWTGPWNAAFYGGASNATGFLFAQALQNALMPVNNSWADARKKGKQQLKYTENEVLLPYRTPYG